MHKIHATMYSGFCGKEMQHASLQGKDCSMQFCRKEDAACRFAAQAEWDILLHTGQKYLSRSSQPGLWTMQAPKLHTQQNTNIASKTCMQVSAQQRKDSHVCTQLQCLHLSCSLCQAHLCQTLSNRACAHIGVSVVTAVQEQGFEEVAQLCDEVEIGDRDAELQLLHQLPSVHTLQDIIHSRSSVFGKQLLQQACLCSVAPAPRSQ